MWWYFSGSNAAEAEWLRPAFMRYVRARGVEEADYSSVELIFGELVSNVVRHAPGEISVGVEWEGDFPVLTVCDRGPGFELHPTLPEDLLAESGRGLFLVQMFGDDLRVAPNPGGGARVSVTLRVPRSQHAPRRLTRV
jgi:anti-sigma regulatory factor (Ser/Thr protein kinase)